MVEKSTKNIKMGNKNLSKRSKKLPKYKFRYFSEISGTFPKTLFLLIFIYFCRSYEYQYNFERRVPKRGK